MKLDLSSQDVRLILLCLKALANKYEQEAKKNHWKPSELAATLASLSMLEDKLTQTLLNRS